MPRFHLIPILGVALVLTGCADEPSPRSTRGPEVSDAAANRVRAEAGSPSVTAQPAAPPRQRDPNAPSPTEVRIQREIARAQGSAARNCRGVEVRLYIGTLDNLNFARAYAARDFIERSAMKNAAADIGAWSDVQHFLARNGSAMRDGGLNTGEQIGFAIATVLGGQMGYAHPSPAERDRRIALLGDMATSALFDFSWFCVTAART